MQVFLTVAKGNSAGKQIPIPVPVFLIGRSDDCHLRPKSDAISRRHCELSVDGDDVWVKDLGSKNGTVVNGKKISDRVRLEDGDLLKVGKLEFTLAISHPASEEQEVDIADWLAADEEEAAAKVGDPETRQFRLDETSQGQLNEAVEASQADEAEGEDAETKQTIDASAEDTAKAGAETEAAKDDTTGFFLSKGKKDKGKAKKPGKLPSRGGPSSESSTEAAADTLKKFFNNRD